MLAEDPNRQSLRGFIGLTSRGRADVASKVGAGWISSSDGIVALQIIRSLPLPDSIEERRNVKCFDDLIVVQPDGTVLLRRQPGSPKQVYFHIGKDVVAFDDELDRLAKCSGVSTTSFDDASLLHFLWRGRAIPGRTFYSGIQSLLHGEELLCDPNKHPRIRRFWWPLYNGDVPDDEKELRKEAIRRLDEALARAVKSSELTALMLSGGVDSSLLAALGVRQRMNLSAFTISFDTSYGLNETEFAKKVASSNSIPHHDVHLDVDGAIGLLGKVLDAKLPRAAPAAITNDALLSAIGSHGINVALSALGADECFGGYHKMLEYLAVNLLEPDKSIHRTLDGLESQPDKLLELNARMFPGVAEFFTLSELLCIAKDSGLLYDILSVDSNFYKDCLNVKPGANPLELMAAHEYQFRLADLLLPTFTIQQKNFSPFIAYPFLDPSLYLWASALDPKHSYWHEQDAWWAKRLLRSVALEFLPQEIVMRKRQTFMAPIQLWLLNATMRNVFMQEIADSKLWALGILQSQTREDILSGISSSDVAYRDTRWQHKIWSVLVLCAWINRRDKALQNVELNHHA